MEGGGDCRQTTSISKSDEKQGDSVCRLWICKDFFTVLGCWPNAKPQFRESEPLYLKSPLTTRSITALLVTPLSSADNIKKEDNFPISQMCPSQLLICKILVWFNCTSQETQKQEITRIRGSLSPLLKKDSNSVLPNRRGDYRCWMGYFRMKKKSNFTGTMTQWD